MNGESLVLLIIGIYLLISAYLIIFKEKLFTILFRYTYRSAKLIIDKIGYLGFREVEDLLIILKKLQFIILIKSIEK